VGSNEDILYALSIDASSIEEFKRPMIKGTRLYARCSINPPFAFGSLLTSTSIFEPARAPDRPLHYPRTSVGLDLIPSKSPKASRRACVSTPRGELRYSHLVPTRGLPSIAVLFGADPSFLSCSPLAPIIVTVAIEARFPACMSPSRGWHVAVLDHIPPRPPDYQVPCHTY
jgi:hypothetical protein